MNHRNALITDARNTTGPREKNLSVVMMSATTARLIGFGMRIIKTLSNRMSVRLVTSLRQWSTDN